MKMAIAAVALAASFGVAAAVAPLHTMPTADAVVKLTTDRGHGSAVHIGGGLYLTAAHVVRSDDSYRVVTSTGETASAEVLWRADKYDIAMVRAEIGGIDAVDLECRAPGFGEALEFRGNPLNLEHVSTWGRASGAARNVGTHWAEAVPVDAAIVPGMSGGAVLDADGDLVGINVGVMIMRVGMAGGPAGIGYIVPGDTICGLMAG